MPIAPEPGPRTRQGASASQAHGAAAERAGLALWVALVVLVLARLATAFVPAMWLWGLNPQRFLAPLWAWAPLAAATLALVPPVGNALAAPLARLGDEVVRSRGAAFAALLGGLLVLALPDRVRFVGDFLLRQGTVEQGGLPSVLFPQALPLDVFLHYRLPSALASAGVLDANGAARALGALEAALLAALACGFARSIGARGAVAMAAAAVAFFGATLCMFTGYSKAFAEMVVLVAAAGVFGMRAVREGKGLMPLALTVATGLALHRSAIALLPAAGLAIAWGWRSREVGAPATRARDAARPRDSNAVRIAALVVLLGALAVMLPRIVAVMLRWDAVHLVPHEVQAQGGMLRAAFAGTRPMDMLGLVTALSPIALAVPPVALLLGRVPGRGREAILLATLALPFVLSVPLLHPAQGPYRDWDDFAAMGQALSLLAAWLVAVTLRAAPGRPWLAASVAIGAAAPALQWLLHFSDVDRGLARVEAFMNEAPRRADAERGKTWDYLGIRNLRLGRWDRAASAFSHAAETAPSPRILLQWGTVELRRRNFAPARELFRRVLALSPQDAHAWSGLAAASLELGDRDEARRAADTLLRLRPGDAFGLQTLERLATP